MQNNRKKICIVATIPYALMVFMKPHIKMLAKKYNVTLVTNGDTNELETLLGPHVSFKPINLIRKASPLKDLHSLLSLYFYFRKKKFDVVHSLMPKTALLAMTAAFFARTPHRIHTFTGQVWANKTGAAKFLLKLVDKLTIFFSTDLLADSFSQMQFLIDEGIVKTNKISVLGNGSVCGVDLERFHPNSCLREQVRNNLCIPNDAIVYLYLGRLNKDKGVEDLARAFLSIANSIPNVHLIIAGPDEESLNVSLNAILNPCINQFHLIGYTDRPEDYMASADIFCLPSYREGFGSVVIEAAAVGVPTVASNIYGLADAVKDGETGILFPPKDVAALSQALLYLTKNTEIREKMARQAKSRAQSLFDMNIVAGEMKKFYQSLFLKNDN